MSPFQKRHVGKLCNGFDFSPSVQTQLQPWSRLRRVAIILVGLMKSIAVYSHYQRKVHSMLNFGSSFTNLSFITFGIELNEICFFCVHYIRLYWFQMNSDEKVTGPPSLAWFNLNPSRELHQISNYIKLNVWDLLFIHSKISNTQPLKFENGYVMSSHTL